MLLLYTLASGGIFLLSFLTVTNSRNVNRKANHWFGFFIFSFGCLLLDRVLPETGVYTSYPHLLGLTELTRLAMAPALYISVLYFTSPNRKFQATELLHFVPSLLFLLHTMPFLLQTATEKRAALQGFFPAPSATTIWFGRVLFYAVKVQVLGYWIASYVRLYRHEQHVRLFASTLASRDLSWLKHFLWSLIFLVFLWFNELFFHIEPLLTLTPWLFLAVVYCVSYFSLRQPEVFDFAEQEVAQIGQLIQQQATEERAAVPRLAPSQIQPLKDRLDQLMQREKVYLEADLSLPDLAKLMDLSLHQLSYLLNEGYGKNFFQFVNEYRVEEVKRLLLSTQHRHLNMLGIAYEAGFSSKTTFNTTFKKVVGQSPSQFLEAHNAPPLKEALE